MRGLLFAAVYLLGLPAFADEARPLYVELTSSKALAYAFTWRIPTVFPREMSPNLVLPADCVQDRAARHWSDGKGHWQEAGWSCASPLPGRRMGIDYPRGNPNLATIFKATGSQGQASVALLRPGVSEFAVPASANVGPTTKAYANYIALGIEHIWLGFDHLLFVACLVWIAGRPRRILAAVTGFTLAHSVTLALAALQLVRLPVKAIEVLIALSILMLATELARDDQTTLTWRYPIAVSTGFGLLHGFGFAAALNEVGLPPEWVTAALFSFNVGIEIGQLIFVAALVLVARFALATAGILRVRHARSDESLLLSRPARIAVAYPIGVLAMYWMLQRAGIPLI